MDIFEFAIEKEKYTEQYYKDLAEKTDNPGVKRILFLLASEENKHLQVIEELKNEIPVVAESDLIENAMDILKKMSEGKEQIELNADHIRIYEKALEFEQASLGFYNEKADITKDDGQKKIFLLLAGEERKHILLIEKIIQFLIKPKTWLENAEIFHSEDF